MLKCGGRHDAPRMKGVDLITEYLVNSGKRWPDAVPAK
ncbi:MAG: hypothetical protein JWN71_1340 [Xanthobacteraceae bacterium]|jgi:hypothetical protein|nr:hypothetical protein [Xanthobacteraceae bacterium]